MNKDFWEESWEQGHIGFHQKNIHRYLQQFHGKLLLAERETVFVPLCGKSQDMLWLLQQGASVVGVEISSRAVQDFFTENALDVVQGQKETFTRYKNGNLEILCGDLFELKQEDLGGTRAVYDRASLVALPPKMRRRYADKLASLLPSGSRVLLVSYDYDQAEMSGPPFAVPTSELDDLFAADFILELLADEGALESHQLLANRGLTRLAEKAHLLIRK